MGSQQCEYRRTIITLLSNLNGQKDKSAKTAAINKTSRSKRPVVLYSSIFVMLLSLISVGYYQPSDSTFGSTAVSNVDVVDSSNSKKVNNADGLVDDKLAADIGATVAIQAKMPIAASAANLAVSLAVQKDMAQTDSSTISKPQIIQLAGGDRSIEAYKVKSGDSLDSIASKFGVSKNTIRWANNMSSDTLEVGKKLVVLPVDGVIYTVDSGDTVNSLANRYKTTADRIVAYNDLEVDGLKPSTKIIIPGGVLPTTERPGYEAPQSSSPASTGFNNGSPVPASAFKPSYSTSYPWGWCTYYAGAKSGAPGNWGNANTWAYYAARTPGWSVSKQPTVGAIAQRAGGWGGLGHVAIVDAVSADGRMIKYSDMNGLAGFGAIGRTSQWVPASQYDNYISR